MSERLIDEKPHYTDPLAAAVMAMKHGIKLRVELACGTHIAMGDWLVMEKRERVFRRAFVHSESMTAFVPQVGDIVHYWVTTEPDYFSQSTAKRTKEHCKRVTKHVLFYVTHVSGLSRMRILTRKEKAFYMPEGAAA